MKKWMVVVSLVTVIFSGLASCGTNPESSQSGQHEKQTKQVVKPVQLSVKSDKVETDDHGNFVISGKTEPRATLYINGERGTTADQNGNFEFNNEVKADHDYEAVITAKKKKMKQKKVTVSIVLSKGYLAYKAEEKAREEQTRIEEENERNEANRLLAAAESNLKSSDLDEAKDYITKSKYLTISDYHYRINGIWNKISAKQEELARQEAKKKEEIWKQNEAREREKQAAANAAKERQSSTSGNSDSGNAQASVDKNEQQVLVTKTGSKYHNRKCGNGTYYPATLSEAKARGLTPCSKCYGR
ncbi:hypothetical protein HB912_01875 [Listeria aquatica]|uniref:Lipoprotein n=1 Tax=Listeria aquatica TaxID=1494960 RepID=A0A841ZNW6_9LIST|nr:hypothetical protein [Listeria aquatica]MBC1520391.1 hypothetical protein [Listeria aquatica]